MTQKEFELLPELLRRGQVVACGVPNDAVDDLRVLLKTGDEPAGDGKIGAIQLPGRHCTQKKNAKFKYRKADVGRICGYKTE